MRTLEDDIRAPWADCGDDVRKDYLIPVLLALLDRIEKLEQQVSELRNTPVTRDQ